MLVTNRLNTLLPIADVVKAAIRGGADAVQIREKDLSDEELLDFSRAIQRAAGSATLTVNGSIAVAKKLGIGVQLPERMRALSNARLELGEAAVIGRSVHDREGARDSGGADYLIAGHVFATSSKPGLPPLGLESLADIAKTATAPVIAIGGINRQNVRQVLEHGAKGVAIMSAINASPDPERAAAEIKDAIDSARTEISISLNGRETSLPSGATIQEFLDLRGYRDRLVVIEINGKIAAKNSYSVRVFEAGDSVEIVHFVGGG